MRFLRRSPRPLRCPRAILAAVLLTFGGAGACGPADGADASPVSEALYTDVMAELLRLDQARRSRPMPPLPAPAIGRLSSDTSWKVARREESLRVARADSAARAAVLTRFGVTAAQLEATAMVLAGDTRRSRIVWDSITTRAARQRSAPGGDSAAVSGPRSAS